MIYKEKSVLIYMIIMPLLCATLFAQEKPQVKLGGALRFNYNYSDWKQGSKKRGGDFGFDVFRLNAQASYKQILFDAEYRFYPSSSGGGMLKHGWVGYKFNDTHLLQAGLVGIPFGITPYSSNSFFFNINYYLGLEDDADMGIKYSYTKEAWALTAAFFKNSDELDFGSNSQTSTSRYAYDVAGRNKEVNQVNLQAVYGFGGVLTQQIGVSAMLGGIYNLDTEKMGTHYALALHYVANYGNWNLKAQYTTRKLSPINTHGQSRSAVEMGAYGATYHVAAHFDTYMASLAYTFAINKGILNSIQVYNDFSVMDKHRKGYINSFQNITGCLLDMKPVFVYVDHATGKNHAWLGPQWEDAFASGTSNGWSTRININIGYYF